MKFEGNIVLKSDNNDNNITIYLLSTIDSFLTLITAAFDVNTEPFNTVIKVMNNAKKILHHQPIKEKITSADLELFIDALEKVSVFYYPEKKQEYAQKSHFCKLIAKLFTKNTDKNRIEDI